MTEVKVRIRFAQFILKARKRFVCLFDFNIFNATFDAI